MATVQPTTQLEFHQAMSDFKTMFPDMDDDVIEAVLRSNQGAVDATIDQLLSMTTDNENDKIRHQLEVVDNEGQRPLVAEHDSAIDEKDSSVKDQQLVTKQNGSVSTATGLATLSSETVKRISSKTNGRPNDVTSDSPTAVSSHVVPTEATDIEAVKDSNTSGIADDVNCINTTPLRLKRCWCPPLLGPLPDDFLRLNPLCSTVGYNKIQTEGELEDERIALFLQNEEFMAELRWNKDFLLMLDKDSPPEEILSNFPLNRPNDDDAVFKERLKNMGKTSRKKFSQLARVFTGRKKRSSAKHILAQGPAPSRDNLLLQEEDSDGT